MLPEKNSFLLLPHRPPFIMIGELLHADDQSTRTGYRVEKDNLFVHNGHWTEAGLLENMAQTVGAGAGYLAQKASQGVQGGMLAAVKQFRVVELPQIGDELITMSTILDKVFNMVIARVTIMRGADLIAVCEMSIFIGSQHGFND